MFTENELKSTGLMELWGLGFVPTAIAFGGYGIEHGFHWEPVWNPETMPVVTICYAAYALFGMLCAFAGPSFNNFSRIFPVAMKSRVIFAMIHVAISIVACTAFLFV